MNEPVYHPEKCAGFLIEELEGETVLFHPVRNIIIHANETATLIWQLCDGTRTISEIAEILCEAYPEARPQIEAEVPLAIQELRKKGALEGG